MHALVTGASSGIGAAIARALANAGYELTLVARRRGLLSEIGADSGARIVPFDLSEIERLPALVAEAVAARGPIDVLVNNAGATMVEHTDLVDAEEAERLMRVNLLAPLALTRLVIPSMKERRVGTIVDIASVNAFAPTPYSFHYNASKAGLAAASESLRAEMRPYGLHVMTVYPGPIRTPLLERASARVPVSMPTFAIGTPEGLARRIVRGIERRRDRIVYPRLFAITRALPNASRWSIEHFFPRLASTPRLSKASHPEAQERLSGP
jgi:short-subunit dehydrogenase